MKEASMKKNTKTPARYVTDIMTSLLFLMVIFAVVIFGIFL